MISNRCDVPVSINTRWQNNLRIHLQKYQTFVSENPYKHAVLNNFVINIYINIVPLNDNNSSFQGLSLPCHSILSQRDACQKFITTWSKKALVDPMSEASTLWVIHKLRGQIFLIFLTPPLHPSWSLLLNKAYVIKLSLD